MPDPPSTEPLEVGQPQAKKLKAASEVDNGWVAVERPESEVGVDVGEAPIDDSIPETAEEQADLEEAKETRYTALQTAEAGGDPPRMGLLADW